MAVHMRLRREGKRKQPAYRIVVADSRAPRDGRFIEELGYYHPLSNPSEVKIEPERAVYWLRTGARPSDQVAKLLRITEIVTETGALDPEPASGGLAGHAPDTAESAASEAPA